MNDIFKSHPIIKKVAMLKANDLYPFFRKIEDSEGTVVKVDGRDLIMVGSNNYLGLTHHPHVKECAIKAIEKYGTGCTGSRFLNGNLTIHEELEEKLATYLGHEKAIVFATGMQSNLGAIPTICGPKDLLLFDSENHASLIDASRLAMGTTFKYKHNDMASLEKLLEENINRFKNITIVADGIFSMTGDILKLPEIAQLAEKFGVNIYLDDAHGIGVMGDRGRGTMNHFGLTEKVDINMGTFSKSFATVGGVISGNTETIDYVKHTARSFMFSAAMAPSAVATVSAWLDVINGPNENTHERRWSNVKLVRDGFAELGFYTYNSKTPIIPIFIGDDIKAMQVTQYLKEMGVFATPVISPAVPKGEALIRTSYMASHSHEELGKVLEVFKAAKEKFSIPSGLN